MPPPSKAKRSRQMNANAASQAAKRLKQDDENYMPASPARNNCLNDNFKKKNTVDAFTQTEVSLENCKKGDEMESLTGRCLLGMQSINEVMKRATKHTAQCKKGPVKMKCRTKAGLASKIYFSCGCGKTFAISTNDDSCSLDANKALSWGCQASAIGFQAATSMLTCLDLPTPSWKTFKKQQDCTFKDMWKEATKEMKKWAEKEVELAKEAGNYVTVQGHQYPAITVIVDGGWGKRSYGHSFSSMCGVAVIIGARTKKVIYADVKIASCGNRDKKTPGLVIKKHDCFKNWTLSPTKMESAILKEGFQKSIPDYGLVYHKFIGDGDSSVFSTVQDVYGPDIRVEKIECMNHVVKNLTSRLLEISKNMVKGQDSPNIDTRERSRINPLLPRIRTGVRRAIIYNKQNDKSWMALREDILNVLAHVFGEHSNCKPYFCNGPKPGESNHYEMAKRMKCYCPLLKVINKVADLSTSLIHGLTSNPAECFMSVVSKYVEGKRKHFGQGYLYKLRVCGAIFSYNETTFWASHVYRMLYGNQPHALWSKQYNTSCKKRQYVRKYRVSRPLKFPALATSGDWDYGSNPRRPDLPIELLRQKIQEKREQLQVTKEEQTRIEESTRLQSHSDEWYGHRKGRLTASFAGKIYKLRDTTDNTDVLNQLFNRTRHSKQTKEAMQYGNDNEFKAIDDYELIQGLPKGTVKKVGIVVSTQHGELGASPDGAIGTDGLLEVKCPYSLFKKNLSAADWPTLNKDNCSFFRDRNGQYQMKTNHDHYYQVIQQLYVTNRIWCDYMVWTENGSVIIRITRNATTDKLWMDMLAKHLRFWENDIAPELVDSRYERGFTEYYCPESRKASREKKKEKRC